MEWNTEDEKLRTILNDFWYAPENKPILSPKGQRKCSDKLLIDGEVFFAVFLGPTSTIRTIDPLEITEIITNPDDIEDVRYYKREWFTPQGQGKVGYYCSFSNKDNVQTADKFGTMVGKTEEALVYHLSINTIGQRGNPLLLPVIDWVKLYRQFLASRVAVMLALARFAWKAKVQGGQTQVDNIKNVYNDQYPPAGSVSVENMSADMQPIRTDSNARNAYDDGRMLKLQISAGTGWPEQYFGDISIGNLATAKTVELPVSKMCQSYQSVWSGVFEEIDDLVLDYAGFAGDRFVDRDFPAIAPEDQAQMAQSFQAIVAAFPDFAYAHDVQQAALLSLGINNADEVLQQLEDYNKEEEEKAAVPGVPGAAPVPAPGQPAEAGNMDALAKANAVNAAKAIADGIVGPSKITKESNKRRATKLVKALKEFRETL
jgi:hypothetical protein